MADQQLTPEQERDIIKPFVLKKLEKGEVWFVVSGKWWRSWTKYSTFHSTTSSLPGAPPRIRPGPIDNTDIEGDVPEEIRKGLTPTAREFIQEEGYLQLEEWYGSVGPKYPRNVISIGGVVQAQFRIDMYPHFVDVVRANDDGTVNEETSSKYSISQQDSLESLVLSCEEGLRNAGTECGGEIPPIRLWFQKPTIEEVPGEDQRTNSPISAEGPKPVIVDSDDDDEDPSESSVQNGVVELTVTPNRSMDSEGEADMEVGETTTATVDEEEIEDDGWDLVLQTDLKVPYEQLRHKFSSFLIEVQKSDGEWPRQKFVREWGDFRIGDIIDCQDNQKKWYESIIRGIKLDTDGLFIHYEGWPEKWDEWVSFPDETRLAPRGTHTEGPYVSNRIYSSQNHMSSSYSPRWTFYENQEGQPKQRGVVGLKNLGNTCFMNSTLQCLSNTSKLTDYFLSDRYLSDVNEDNPLGWKGQIAMSYGALVKDLWSDKYTAVAPSDFKKKIGEFAPRFSGYNQQDSCELLAFVLDGLHEDLNLVKDKPRTEAIESNHRPDAVVAKEAWNVHLQRNKSVIVDLLQGQLKSTVICPTCRFVSVTFDPFMSLSVPLPTVKNRIQKLVFVPNDPRKRPILLGLKVLKLGMISDLKSKVYEVTGIIPKKQVVCDVWRHKMFKMFENHDLIAELHENDAIYVYEIPNFDPIPGAPQDDEAKSENPSKEVSRASSTSSLVNLPIETSAVNHLSIDGADEGDNMDCDDDGADGGLSTAIPGLRLTQGIIGGGERLDDIDLESGEVGNGGEVGGGGGEAVGGEGVGGGEVGEGSSASSDDIIALSTEDALADATLLRARLGYGEKLSKSIDHKEVPIIIIHQREATDAHRYAVWSRHVEEFGLPQIITLPKNTRIPFEFLQQRIRTVIAPFLKPTIVFDDSNGETPYQIIFKGERGSRCGVCSSTQSCSGHVVKPHNEVDIRNGKVSFALLWNTEFVDSYLVEKYRCPLLHPSAKRVKRLGTAMTDLTPISAADLRSQEPSEIVPDYDDDLIESDSDDDEAREGKPVDLAECLSAYCIKETLSAEDAWYCRRCKDHKEATKKLELWSAPDVVIIHLKRFQHVGDWREKIDILVKFPVNGLELGKWIVNKDQDGTVYDLFAVSNHMGGLGGGHYTAYARNPENSRWYEFDDESTSEMTNPEPRLVSPKAYVLFYAKRGSIPQSLGKENNPIPNLAEDDSDEDEYDEGTLPLNGVSNHQSV